MHSHHAIAAKKEIADGPQKIADKSGLSHTSAMGKAALSVPFGREVVTFSCGNQGGGSAPGKALNGGSQI
jgi:hypothetical protein